jgi:hypothetical protein
MIDPATTITRPFGLSTPVDGAIRIVASTFGAVLALAGIEHGIGEILQGPVAAASPLIESWPNAEAFEILAGEPAMTLVPNLLVSGILTVIVSAAVAVWAVGFVHRRHGGLVLIGLSLLLLAVGGGFGPPLLGIVIGIGATRIGAPSSARPGPVGRALSRAWPWILAVGVLAYLGLFPGLVLLSLVTEVPEGAVYGLAGVAFGSAIASLVAGLAADRETAHAGRRGEESQVPDMPAREVHEGGR